MPDDWSLPRRVAGQSGGASRALAGAVVGERLVDVRIEASAVDAFELGGSPPTAALRRWLELDDGWGVELSVAVAPGPFERPMSAGEDGAPVVASERSLPRTPTVWLVEPDMDDAAWRGQAARTEGSCASLFASLGRGQAQALAELEPFFAVVDGMLARSYRSALERAWPELIAAMDEARSGAGPGDATAAACATAVDELEADLRACLRGERCRTAPRIYVQQVAVMASAGLADGALGACSSTGRADAVVSWMDTVRSPARTSAARVSAQIDPRWTAQTDRLAALIDTHAGLERACAPRRRRVASEDFERLDTMVRDLFARLARPAPDVETSRWRADEGTVHVPGIGKVQVWAVADSGVGRRARLDARNVELAAVRSGRCTRPIDEQPLTWVLTAAGEIVGWGLVYPEQIACGERTR